MDHEVALPLRALRRGSGMDVFMTECQTILKYIYISYMSYINNTRNLN